jgi:hypothetical protein
VYCRAEFACGLLMREDSSMALTISTVAAAIMIPTYLLFIWLHLVFYGLHGDFNVYEVFSRNKRVSAWLKFRREASKAE